jgi:hypothetical protein
MVFSGGWLDGQLDQGVHILMCSESLWRHFLCQYARVDTIEQNDVAILKIIYAIWHYLLIHSDPRLIISKRSPVA